MLCKDDYVEFFQTEKNIVSSDDFNLIVMIWRHFTYFA